MGDAVGTVKFAGQPKAQVQIVDGQNDTRRVHVYDNNGVYLCGCDFKGDNDVGFAVGEALFNGYMAGWANCQYEISKSVTKALYTKPNGGID